MVTVRNQNRPGAPPLRSVNQQAALLAVLNNALNGSVKLVYKISACLAGGYIWLFGRTCCDYSN